MNPPIELYYSQSETYQNPEFSRDVSGSDRLDFAVALTEHVRVHDRVSALQSDFLMIAMNLDTTAELSFSVLYEVNSPKMYHGDLYRISRQYVRVPFIYSTSLGTGLLKLGST